MTPGAETSSNWPGAATQDRWPRRDSGHGYPPPIQVEQTALLPKVLEPPLEPPSLAELAKRHGLRLAWARPPFWSYLREIFRFRQFIASYANGRAAATYGTNHLGRLWQVFTPLLNAAVYYLIFGLIMDAGRGVDNFPAYLCVGIFVFQATQTIIQGGVTSISGQLGLIRAMHFPRAALPIAHTITQLESLMASMAVLAAMVLAMGEPLTLDWVYFIPALALHLLFNLGLGLIVARLGAFVPDVSQIVPFVLRIWMYGSAVLFSVDRFTGRGWLSELLHANPLLIYIQLVRHALMDKIPLGDSTVAELWIMGGAWALVMLVVGFVVFWRKEAEYGSE